MKLDESKTYIGIVEDNDDPKRLNRCRIRVIDIFDEIPTEDIPWASPWKDINGNSSNVPEKGKVLTVVFDSGNIYKPEYIFSEHFNINLEKKLEALSKEDYLSMKSLIFDHKTQIYVNESEGLKIDHKYHNMNITKDGVDINLKDNFGKVNIGDADANQEAILGTNFLTWFDEFVDNLLGTFAGPFLGNMGAPVVPNPAFISVLQKYKALKDPKFLSDNIFFNDNNDISSVRITTSMDETLRPDISQYGDNWKSTIKENEVEFKEEEFKPKYGTGNETPESYSSNGDDVSLSTGDDPDGPAAPIIEEPDGEINPDVQKIIEAMKEKDYEVIEDPYYINIVGIRYQYEGQPYSNKFKDRIWSIWKNDSGKWESKNWASSTIPGLFMKWRSGLKMKKWCSTNRKKGLGILVPAQYKGIYKMYEASASRGMKASPYFRSRGDQLAYRDKAWDTDTITYGNKNSLDVGNHAMFIHRGFPGGTNVNNWSEGCQIFSKDADYKQFCNLARNHIEKHNNKFNYTLLMSSDVDES